MLVHGGCIALFGELCALWGIEPLLNSSNSISSLQQWYWLCVTCTREIVCPMNFGTFNSFTFIAFKSISYNCHTYTRLQHSHNCKARAHTWSHLQITLDVGWYLRVAFSESIIIMFLFNLIHCNRLFDGSMKKWNPTWGITLFNFSTLRLFLNQTV